MAKQGGDETRSGYVRYVHGIQPNIPAHAQVQAWFISKVLNLFHLRTPCIPLYIFAYPR